MFPSCLREERLQVGPAGSCLQPGSRRYTQKQVCPRQSVCLHRARLAVHTHSCHSGAQSAWLTFGHTLQNTHTWQSCLHTHRGMEARGWGGGDLKPPAATPPHVPPGPWSLPNRDGAQLAIFPGWASLRFIIIPFYNQHLGMPS